MTKTSRVKTSRVKFRVSAVLATLLLAAWPLVADSISFHQAIELALGKKRND